MFEDKIQLVVFANHLFQLDDVGMVQLAQGLHLTKGDGLFPAVKLAFHLLDSHHLVRLPVRRFPHAAVRAVPELSSHFVSIHRNEPESGGTPTARLRGTVFNQSGHLPRRSAPPIKSMRPLSIDFRPPSRGQGARAPPNESAVRLGHLPENRHKQRHADF